MNDASLLEIASGTFAYLQRRKGWGFSNAGLVTSGEASLLVDTLYDLRLTQAMLATMRRATVAAERIDSVVNTHANGDHCWGNAALPDASIVASRATADEMLELSPRLMHTLVVAARVIARTGRLTQVPLGLLGRLGISRAAALVEAAPLLLDAFGAFDFGNVSLRPPDQTFEGQLELTVGDKRVRLIEVGPAHTRGDTIVYVPEDRVVFTGDILFIGSHPIVWEGPIDNWLRACDVILELDVEVVVPGHGPLTDKDGVRATRDYWQHVRRDVQQGHASGSSPAEIARGLCVQYDQSEAERMIVNVDTALRELSGTNTKRDPLALLAAMADFARSSGA